MSPILDNINHLFTYLLTISKYQQLLLRWDNYFLYLCRPVLNNFLELSSTILLLSHPPSIPPGGFIDHLISFQYVFMTRYWCRLGLVLGTTFNCRFR